MSKLEAVSTLHWPKIYICHISRNSCGFELFACETNFKKKAQCEIEPQPKSCQYTVINYLVFISRNKITFSKMFQTYDWPIIRLHIFSVNTVNPLLSQFITFWKRYKLIFFNFSTTTRMTTNNKTGWHFENYHLKSTKKPEIYFGPILVKKMFLLAILLGIP